MTCAGWTALDESTVTPPTAAQALPGPSARHAVASTNYSGLPDPLTAQQQARLKVRPKS